MAARSPAGQTDLRAPDCSISTSSRSSSRPPATAASDVPIWAIGGKGVFVKEVQAAVLDGRADIAVHSAKDLPSEPPPTGWCIAAVPERGDPRDALVGATLDDLPIGAAVATGSVRRRAQLAAHRPDLTFAGLRGNIETRLRKAAQFDAVVVAAAALHRLGRSDVIAERPRRRTLSCPRSRRARWRSSVGPTTWRRASRSRPSSTTASRRAVDAERAFLAELGGDCDLPAGAHATVDDGGDASAHRCAREHSTAECRCAPEARVTTRTTLGRGWPTSCSTGPEVGRCCAELTTRGPGRCDRLPGRRGAGRSRAAHRSGRGGARPGRRRRLRPAVGRARCSTSRRPGAERISVGKAPRRGDDAAGTRSTRCSSSGAARAARSCGSRAATRSCSPAAARRRLRSPRPASRSRSCPASPRPIAVPAYAGIPVTHRATRPRRSRSSPATRTPGPPTEHRLGGGRPRRRHDRRAHGRGRLGRRSPTA